MFPTSKTSAERLYHRILVAAWAAFIAGCGVQPEDEITACTNVMCSAGTCRLIDGTPTCVCGPAEVVQGLECAVIQSRTESEPDDFGDEFTTAAELPLGQAIAGTISNRVGTAADVDMFWVQTTPGLAYLFGCSWCSVEVLQSDGTVATKINNTWREFAARATSERLYVRATGGRSTSYTIYGNLILDDVPNTHDGAASAAEGYQSYRFEVNDDEDVYTFVASPDSAYMVEVPDSVTAEYRTRVDIEAADGTVLATGDGAAGVRDQSGPLFIRLATTTSPRFYSWRLQRSPRDDYPDTPAVAASKTFPFSVQGTLEASDDADAFSFVVPRDHGVTVSCGAVFPATCQVDILDSAGALVAANPKGKTIQLTAGTYVALVRGIGKYDLRLDWYDDYPTSPSLTVQPSVITGEIDYENDRDGVWLLVTPDHYYRATCTSSTGSCTAVPGTMTRNGSEFRAAHDTGGKVGIDVQGTVGPYELNLEDLGYDAEPGLEGRWENLLAFSSTLRGSFEVGWDTDCFIFGFGAGTYAFEQTAGDPMQVRLDGSVSTLPATISFAPQTGYSYPVCFAPAPWFTDNVRGSTGPYAVTMTSP